MDLRASLLAAARHMLVPIARLMVRNGVGFGDFVDAGKAVLKERGLAATPARMSVETGLTRRDVERIVDDPMRYAVTPSSEWNAAIQVLHAWHTRPPYVLIPVSLPLELEYDTPNRKQTFVSLVRSAVPGADPARVLAILLEIGAVEKDRDTARLRPLTRYIIPARMSEHQIRFVARAARRLLDTIDVNMSREPDEGRFERCVVADRGIPAARYADFVSFIRKIMARALEDIDDWIADNARPSSDEPVVWPGVGMYHWLDDPDDEQFPLDYTLAEVRPSKG